MKVIDVIMRVTIVMMNMKICIMKVIIVNLKEFSLSIQH